MNQKLKRSLFFLALCLCAAGMARAQETAHPDVPGQVYHLFVGINAGYANNTLYTSNDDYRTNTEYRSGHGFTISVPIRYQIFTWLGLQLEPAFIQKKYSIHRTDDLGLNSAINKGYNMWTNSFVDFPILINLSMGIPRLPVLRVFSNTGGWVGVWADSHIKGAQQTFSADLYDYYEGDDSYLLHKYDDTVEFDSRRDNRFDAGLIIGGGVQYSLKSFTFNVECRYYYSLTDLQKHYMRELTPKMNDTVVVQAGVAFNSSVFDIIKRWVK